MKDARAFAMRAREFLQARHAGVEPRHRHRADLQSLRDDLRMLGSQG